MSAASWILPSGAARGRGGGQEDHSPLRLAGLSSAENSFALPSGREGTLRALRFSAINPLPPPHPVTFGFLNIGGEQPLFTCLGLS